jgi:hypothetical protein
MLFRMNGYLGSIRRKVISRKGAFLQTRRGQNRTWKE